MKHHIKAKEVVKEIYKFTKLEENKDPPGIIQRNDIQNNILIFERFIQEWYLDNEIKKIGFETLKSFKDKVGLPDLKQDDTIKIGKFTFIRLSKTINNELGIKGDSYLISV